MDRRRRSIKLRLKDKSLRGNPEVRRWVRDVERRMERKMEAQWDALAALMPGILE